MAEDFIIPFNKYIYEYICEQAGVFFFCCILIIFILLSLILAYSDVCFIMNIDRLVALTIRRGVDTNVKNI